MTIFTLIKGKRGASGFGYASTAEDVTEELDLSGKTILITGVNSGLGLESACVLSKRGAHIIALARTLEKAQHACVEIGGKTTPVACELSDPASIRSAIDTIRLEAPNIDVLMGNAGIAGMPELKQQCGFEAQFFTNHMGHFLLFVPLLEQLAGDGRVVMVSSMMHGTGYDEGIQLDNLTGENGYNGNKAYAQAKLANLLFAKELASRFEGTNRVAIAVHPGAVPTAIARRMQPGVARAVNFIFTIATKNVHQGAATQVYAAVHPDAASQNGAYFSDCNAKQPSEQGQDAEMARKLWQKSEEIAATV